MLDKPVVVVMIGDPCGIGPEVVVKALASGEVYPACRPVLVGSADVMEDAVRLTGSRLTVRTVSSVAGAGESPDTIDIIDLGNLKPADVTVGDLSPACGRAVVEWRLEADRLVQSGEAQAGVMAPINAEAIDAGGLKGLIEGQTGYLLLITGAMRVVHLTDHMPLSQVPGEVTKSNVLSLLQLIHESLEKWGIPKPRIGVPGLNPHASGREEREEIVPAIEAARSMGIDAIGPVPADTIYRLAADGAYDIILALYHDQGHIPTKVYKFEGIAALHLGKPFIRTSVAHGTAFDIAGKGSADPSAVLMSIKLAASLAAGRGFPSV